MTRRVSAETSRFGKRSNSKGTGRAPDSARNPEIVSNGSTRGQRGNARPDAAETNANGGKSIKTRGSRHPTSRGAGRVEPGLLANTTALTTLVVCQFRSGRRRFFALRFRHVDDVDGSPSGKAANFLLAEFSDRRSTGFTIQKR